MDFTGMIVDALRNVTGGGQEAGNSGGVLADQAALARYNSSAKAVGQPILSMEEWIAAGRPALASP
jgi:hypothetical protein